MGLLLLVVLGCAGYIEQRYGPIDPFANGMHALVRNDTQDTVNVVDASGTYHFLLKKGDERSIVAPDYRHPQDMLTVVKAGGGRLGCITVVFQVQTQVIVNISSAVTC
jgi:hypothetical protein